jgi:hypothetical protein
MIQRQTMRFLIPLSTNALSSDDSTDRAIIPLYINPQSVSINESKLINKTLTKGGYLIQYWGEDLPKIQVSGITASGGIEAINILRDVYRHEQLQFSRILLDRARLFNETAPSELNTATSSVQTDLVQALDNVLNGSLTSITDGIVSTIDTITDIFQNASREQVQRVELIPTLAAFAVSIDLYFQGEKFRGYFNDFQVSESAETPGHFNYTFNFEVIKRSGVRKNFMPWHRNPRDGSGQPRSASVPIEGPAVEELTFPISAETVEGIIGNRFTTSTFFDGGFAAAVDINNVGVNRFNKVKS